MADARGLRRDTAFAEQVFYSLQDCSNCALQERSLSRRLKSMVNFPDGHWFLPALFQSPINPVQDGLGVFEWACGGAAGHLEFLLDCGAQFLFRATILRRQTATHVRRVPSHKERACGVGLPP